MLIRIGLLNYVAGALLMPYAPFLAAARALRHDMEALAARFGVSLRAGVPAALHPAAAGRARRAVLLPARRSGGQRVEAVLRRRAFRSRAMAAPARAGWCTRRSRRPGAMRGAGRGTAGRRGVPVLRAHRDRAPAARWGEPPPVHVVAMGCAVAHAGGGGLRRRASTWSAPRSASACRAGCATGRTAAAARFRRWSTGWRSIRITAAPARTGSR